MKTDDLLRRQLRARLQRLLKRQATTAADIELVQQLLVDIERKAMPSRLRLRSNSVQRLSIQARVKECLADKDTPVRAKMLYDKLRETEPGLKSSTFRSHIKRLVDAGIIKREGSRGHYQLVEQPNDEGREKEVFPRQRKPVRFRYI